MKKTDKDRKMQMKKTAAGLAAILLGCLMVAGCTQAPAQPSATPMPTQDTTHKEYQNYMTMTTLKYPASWEYQDPDDDQDSQMTAYFDIDGGTAVLQFLFLTEEEKQSNVYLQQLDIDDIAQEETKAGPYEGLLLSGTNGADKISVFQGYRSWYDTGLYCMLRVYINSTTEDSDNLYEIMMDILESTSVYEEETPEIQQWAEQDFTEEYGIKLSVPSDWYINPEYYSELPTLVLKFEVQRETTSLGWNTAPKTKKGTSSCWSPQRALPQCQCINGTYTQKGNATELSGVYEGRLAYAKIERKKTVDGKIKYLMISYQLRPELQKAYQGAIDQMAQSIVLQ